MNLNAAHLHIMINHAPVMWLPICVVLLGVALVRRDATGTHLALIAVAIAGVATVVVSLTGDPAADALRHVAGVDRSLISRHDDAAGIAMTVSAVAGGLALVGLIVWRRKVVPRWALAATFLAAVGALGLVVWCSELGGQVRHPEARSGWSAPGGAGEGADK
jgi:hypothetical protein